MVLKFMRIREFLLQGICLSKTLRIHLYIFDCFYFFFLNPSPSCSLSTVSSNMDQVLSVNPSANLFVFGDFSIHHNEWLIYSGRTTRLDELCYNCPSQTTLLRFNIVFPALVNSHYVVGSVSIEFPSNSGRDAVFIIQLITILERIGIVLVIMWERFHARITFRLVLQQLLLIFVGKSRSKLLYIHIYQVVYMRSSLIHLHSFQLLFLLSLHIETTSYVHTKIMSLLHLK